jgi:RNA-directed DNA polymerase
VRYADDFVVFCESQEDALRVKDRLLPAWLAERGLSLSPEKTRIVHLTEGFDFLGFNIRHYEAPQTSRSGFKLLIKPSKKAVAAKRKELRDVWLHLKGHNIQAVLRKLNPIIRGWANYYRTVVASRVFGWMDHWMHCRCERYVKRRHPNKSWRWMRQHYWGRLEPQRNDYWVFGDKRTGRYLLKFSWFKIVRHELVRGTASPDDPSLRAYWWERRRINIWHLNAGDRRLAVAQKWTCTLCGMDLFNGEEIHRHHKLPRVEGGDDADTNRELVHLYCHQQITSQWQQRRRLLRSDCDDVE